MPTRRPSAASLADTQVSIAAEVAVDYMNLRGYQARLAIARNNLAAQEETLQITQWRAQAGLATSLDVEQARATTETDARQSAGARSEHRSGPNMHSRCWSASRPPP